MNEQSAAILERMSRRTARAWLLLPIVFIGVMHATASDVPAKSTSDLNSLASYFNKARALPVGTRPPPPHANLRKLIGLAFDEIRGALGPPDPPDDYDWQCHATRCAVYSYGADERNAPVRTGDAGNGIQWIEVSTGGPWVLILGVSSSDKVVSARWEGQK
jgi:hypothetical protein